MTRRKQLQKKWWLKLGLALGLSLLIVVGAKQVTLKQAACAGNDGCKNLPILAIENGETGVFENQIVVAPKIIENESQESRVLGEQVSTKEKRIEVNLATQTLTAYQDEEIFMTAMVSTGKWNKTPPGEYTIWVKMRATRMSGGQGNDYYNLPNVPYVMFFANDKVPKISGFSLHGAYWHNNFGHPMSHGCVNMREVDAEKLYNWVSPITDGKITYADKNNKGTKVVIY